MHSKTMPPSKPLCVAVVYRRDTYRYTGRVKGGFEMHYTKSQCRRAAGLGGFCWQHAKTVNEVLRSPLGLRAAMLAQTERLSPLA